MTRNVQKKGVQGILQAVLGADLDSQARCSQPYLSIALCCIELQCLYCMVCMVVYRSSSGGPTCSCIEQEILRNNEE